MRLPRPFRKRTPRERLKKAWGSGWVDVLVAQRKAPDAKGWYVSPEQPYWLKWWDGNGWVPVWVWPDVHPLEQSPLAAERYVRSRWTQPLWPQVDLDAMIEEELASRQA